MNLTYRGALGAALTALTIILFGTNPAIAQSTIAFVQENYSVPQAATTVVTVSYPGIQSAGNLNVVVVGWNDTTAQVQSVTDTEGNPYTLAVGPTVLAGMGTQAIYYAGNIQAAAANANVVTVMFNRGAQYADVRIAEYHGIAQTSALDVSVAGTGTGTPANSGAVTTTGANDLLVGANLVSGTTTGPGTSYTTRLVTNPDGDILEDRVVTAVGSYSATASVSGGAWIMQLVAFRAASAGPPTPGITSLSPSSGTVGTPVTIAGTNFGSTQGTSTVAFNGTAAAPTSWSASSIVVPVPAGAATGPVVVMVGGVASNGVSFTVVSPTGAITFTQGKTIDAGTTTSTSLAFSANTTAGNFIAVAIRAGGPNQAFTVTDSSRNSYQQAIQVNNGTDDSLAIYYAQNIAGGANTVTVSDAVQGTMRVAILEYAGIAVSNPLDVAVAAQGSGTAPSSGSAATTASGDLLLGAIVAADTPGFAAGSGYTIEESVPTAPGTKLIAEDAIQALAGSASAGATLQAADSWAAALAAFRMAPSGQTGTQPPTAPSGLGATAISATQITLTWTASADGALPVNEYLVERCQGAGCTAFTQLTATGHHITTLTDQGLTPATSYSYRVRAADTSGNLSPYSNTATATTQADTQAPTAPSGLGATAASANQITLTWTAATDNVGVTGYLVERCQGAGCTTFTQVGTPAGTMYSDSGLAASTSYSYRVRATDAAGNLSLYSNTASATTPVAIAFVQANDAVPQTPSTVVTVPYPGAQTSGNLNVVVVGWNDTTAQVQSVTDTEGNSYTIAVGPTVLAGLGTQAIYYAQNIQAAAANANVVTVTFNRGALAADIRIAEYRGTAQSNVLDVSVAGQGTGTLSSSGAVTTTSADDLLVGANLVGGMTTGPGTSYTSRLISIPDGDILEDRVVTAVGSYSATASVSGAAWIMQLVAFRGATGVTADTQLPTAPSALGATAASPSQINLAWTASTDNSGVTGYLVERCQGAGCTTFTQIAAPGIGTTYSDMGLMPATSYSYRVRATDAAGNLSPYSNTASSATPGGGGFSISPTVAALTPTQTQQFTTSGGTSTIVWSVDGAVGGSSGSGTITASGVYSPPASPGTHTVTATTSDQLQSVSSTVYITSYPGTFTFHNDNLRTGQNLSETVLNPTTVSSGSFGQLLSYPLDGLAHASPLYVASVSIPGNGFHNVVYVATEHDTVYAFDADGLSASPLWQVSFIDPAAGVTTVPSGDTGECCDIAPEIGITSTPVIDQTTGTLYVVAKTKEVVGGTTSYVQRLHAIDITTGAEKFGGPAVIQATVPGNGSGSQNGQLAFDPLRENQRPGLLLSNGIVYLAFASHGDNGAWHGWILGYNATTLQQTAAYNSTADGIGGGIWQSGGGPAADPAGNIYFVTGNGPFDVNVGDVDYGDTFVKLSPSGAVLDYFTPHDQGALASNDLDLGSGGVLLLPDQSGANPHLIVSAGKDATIYLVDRDNMGHYNASNDNQIVQSLVNIFPFGDLEPGNFSAPVYFNGSVYFSPINDNIQAFQLDNGLLSALPTSRSSEIYAYPGGSLAISANTNAGGIVWAVLRQATETDDQDVSGTAVLYAYDANNLGAELYNSQQGAGSRDALKDPAVKFSIPLVANGKTFVVTRSKLTVFGLLP